MLFTDLSYPSLRGISNTHTGKSDIQVCTYRNIHEYTVQYTHVPRSTIITMYLVSTHQYTYIIVTYQERVYGVAEGRCPLRLFEFEMK